MGSIPGTFDKKSPTGLTDQQVEGAIQTELGKWKAAQMDPNGVGHNIFQLDAFFTAIVRLLIEKEVLSEDEVAPAVNRRMLEKLTEIREQFEGEVLKARLTEGIKNAPLLGPDGKPVKII